MSTKTAEDFEGNDASNHVEAGIEAASAYAHEHSSHDIDTSVDGALEPVETARGYDSHDVSIVDVGRYATGLRFGQYRPVQPPQILGNLSLRRFIPPIDTGPGLAVDPRRIVNVRYINRDM